MLFSQTLEPPNLPAGGSCVALGLFNGLHLGHMAVIGAMRRQALAHRLTSVVFTFSTARCTPNSKGSVKQMLSQSMSNAILSKTGVEQVVCPDFSDFRAFTPEQFVDKVLRARLGAGRVVCGYDFRFGKGAAGDAHALRELCAPLGIAADIVPQVDVNGELAASRSIRALIESGDIPAANRLLGRPFAIDFQVIHGQKLGRTLGWPTINQAFPPDFVLPRFGIYASLTTVNGKDYSSVTYVGVRPTVDSGAALSETYIQSFDGDLYGRHVKVAFLAFLRPEQKFSDLETLKNAISADAARAKELIKQLTNVD